MKQLEKLIALVLIVAGSVTGSDGQEMFPLRSADHPTHVEGRPSVYRPGGTVRWEETFNSTTQPQNWRVVDHDGSGSSWAYRELIVFTNGDSVRPQIDSSFWFASFLGADSAGHIDEYLISPRLPLVVGPYDSLHFYAGAVDEGYDDSLRVFISTTDSALSSFLTQITYFKVDGVIDSTGSIWHRYSMSIAQFAGESIFVAVNYYIIDGGPSGTNSDNVWVDHFSVEEYLPASVSSMDQFPRLYSVSQNYPNPFNPSTTIEFAIQTESRVRLIVYNVLGREIRSLVDGFVLPGVHSVVWDGRSTSGLPVASGAYVYEFEAEGFVKVQRMVLLK